MDLFSAHSCSLRDCIRGCVFSSWNVPNATSSRHLASSDHRCCISFLIPPLFLCSPSAHCSQRDTSKNIKGHVTAGPQLSTGSCSQSLRIKSEASTGPWWSPHWVASPRILLHYCPDAMDPSAAAMGFHNDYSSYHAALPSATFRHCRQDLLVPLPKRSRGCYHCLYPCTALSSFTAFRAT